jgi:Uma2 family endonuclease
MIQYAGIFDNIQGTQSPYAGLSISKQDFLAWEPEYDGWKYEWSQGKIETNEERMKDSEQYIVSAILRAFTQTRAFADGDMLLPEVDCHLESLQKIRRPDIVHSTREQRRLAQTGVHTVPAFVAGIISPNDKREAGRAKIDEYFAAGVETVWYVYPQAQIVEVYTTPLQVTICTGAVPCSAAPALGEFSMPTYDIFAL